MSDPAGLVVFLRARLDEDEAIARDALAPDENGESTAWWWDRPEGRAERHLSHWAPTRVLAEVEAKRRIVDLHAGRLVEGRDQDGNEREGYFCVEDDDEMPCRTLHLLALPYAGHPDYRPDWRP